MVLASCLAGATGGRPVALAQGAPTDQDDHAREAFARGRAAYDAGEFEAAASAFERAHALSGKPGLLYNLYLAYRDANMQERAAGALRAYLAEDADVPNRPQLEARLKALETGMEDRKARAASPTDVAVAAVPAPLPEAAASPVQTGSSPLGEANARWWLAPAIVMGAGSALAIASIGTGVAANSKADYLAAHCPNSICDESLRGKRDAGHALAVTTDVLLFGGAATVAAGAVWLFLKKPRAAEHAHASVACTRAGCVGTASLRF